MGWVQTRQRLTSWLTLVTRERGPTQSSRSQHLTGSCRQSQALLLMPPGQKSCDSQPPPRGPPVGPPVTLRSKVVLCSWMRASPLFCLHGSEVELQLLTGPGSIHQQGSHLWSHIRALCCLHLHGLSLLPQRFRQHQRSRGWSPSPAQPWSILKNPPLRAEFPSSGTGWNGVSPVGTGPAESSGRRKVRPP